MSMFQIVFTILNDSSYYSSGYIDSNGSPNV